MYPNSIALREKSISSVDNSLFGNSSYISSKMLNKLIKIDNCVKLNTNICNELRTIINLKLFEFLKRVIIYSEHFNEKTISLNSVTISLHNINISSNLQNLIIKLKNSKYDSHKIHDVSKQSKLNNEDLCIDINVFIVNIFEISKIIKENKRYKKNALTLIQYYIEEYISFLLKEALIYANHANRKYISIDDIKLAEKINIDHNNKILNYNTDRYNFDCYILKSLNNIDNSYRIDEICTKHINHFLNSLCNVIINGSIFVIDYLGLESISIKDIQTSTKLILTKELFDDVINKGLSTVNDFISSEDVENSTRTERAKINFNIPLIRSISSKLTDLSAVFLAAIIESITIVILDTIIKNMKQINKTIINIEELMFALKNNTKLKELSKNIGFIINEDIIISLEQKKYYMNNTRYHDFDEKSESNSARESFESNVISDISFADNSPFINNCLNVSNSFDSSNNQDISFTDSKNFTMSFENLSLSKYNSGSKLKNPFLKRIDSNELSEEIFKHSDNKYLQCISLTVTPDFTNDEFFIENQKRNIPLMINSLEEIEYINDNSILNRKKKILQSGKGLCLNKARVKNKKRKIKKRPKVFIKPNFKRFGTNLII